MNSNVRSAFLLLLQLKTFLFHFQDYIDLRFPLESKFSLSESEESGIDDQGESSRDSANATGEDSDSVFEHNNRETIDVDLGT